MKQVLSLEQKLTFLNCRDEGKDVIAWPGPKMGRTHDNCLDIESLGALGHLLTKAARILPAAAAPESIDASQSSVKRFKIRVILTNLRLLLQIWKI